MNLATVSTIVFILFWIQITLTGMGYVLMLLVTFFVVIPEFGLQNVGRDRKQLSKFFKESKHPLCQWSHAIDPFAYWPINGPVVLYQRLIKGNKKSTFDNPYGRDE